MNIESPVNGFVGEKIKMSKIMNKAISVHAYKIAPSKFEGQRLDMQIEVDGVKRVVWTSSTKLMEVIEKVKKEDFPFGVTIIEENECYKFT